VDVLARISGSSPVTITPSANLIEDVGLDSLGFYEILIEAEECLGLRIPEQALLEFRTVADIQHYLDCHLPAANGQAD
jgi:acyl carrier protein